MLHLLLVIHNHQPLGNLPEVFRKAFDIAYKPFIDVVRRHPGIKWALHTSGCLWEWLESEEPGYLDILREEHAAGRLEFVTGGMWEPIQPLIGENSFHHQFRSMHQYLNDKFGVSPTGSWTTERVWEPSLAGRLADAGVRYTLLDDSQLRAGLPSPDNHRVWGYYRTEHNGKSVAVFPINEKLRYFIPFQKAEEVLKYLEDMARELPNNAAITYGDDGEKFGLWPETFEWVYSKGWLDRFFTLIENSSEITTTHPAEYMKIMPNPRQRVYVPTTSYREMGLWNLYPSRNLAADRINHWVESQDDLKVVEPPHVSGLFRTFLSRYPESRYMHERVHELIRTIESLETGVVPDNSPDASPASRALWHALRAQCNCTYWHGVFGGLYLNYLRFAVMREVLHAERELQNIKPPAPTFRHIGTMHFDPESSSFKPDTECVLLAALKSVNWVIDMTTGQVISAGSTSQAVDVIDVIARRFEAYHATMVEEGEAGESAQPASIHDMREVAPAGWRDGFGYDAVQRGCFAGRLIGTDPGIDGMARVDYEAEFGPESGPWSCDVRDNSVILENIHNEWQRKKIFLFNDDGSECVMQMNFKRGDGNRYGGYIFIEFNAGLLAGDSQDRYHHLPDGSRLQLGVKHEVEGVSKTSCIDEWTGVKVDFTVPAADRVGFYPVRTLSRGEGGLEMTYQGTCIVFRIPVEIPEGRDFSLTAFMEITRA